MQVLELGYKIAREQRALEELVQKNQRLRIEVEWWKNPAHALAMAKRSLKMETPDSTRIRLVSAAASGEIPNAEDNPALASR
jgi:hypothetical protein